MAFHDVRIAEGIERKSKVIWSFRTAIIALNTGFERRNINWAQYRLRADIGYGARGAADLREIIDFYIAREGMAHGWRFKNWLDYQIGDYTDAANSYQAIGLGDDSTTQFQVYKRYTSGSTTYDKTIRKLVSGTVKVLLDGAVQGSGYTVDVNTGLITFSVAPASTGGTGAGGAVEVGVACEFDFPVRFDTDDLQAVADIIDGGVGGELPSIPIVETRDYQ